MCELGVVSRCPGRAACGEAGVALHCLAVALRYAALQAHTRSDNKRPPPLCGGAGAS